MESSPSRPCSSRTASRGRSQSSGSVRWDRILGAAMVGARCEHLAHLLAWAVEQGMTVRDALQMPYYHPVFEEAIQDALYDLDRRLNGPATGLVQLQCLDDSTGAASRDRPAGAAERYEAATISPVVPRKSDMTCLIPPACVFCEHYHSKRNDQTDELPSCNAFAEIPDEIFMGTFDHSEPFPGDDGVQFRLREAERTDFIELNEVRAEVGLMVYRVPVSELELG